MVAPSMKLLYFRQRASLLAGKRYSRPPPRYFGVVPERLKTPLLPGIGSAWVFKKAQPCSWEEHTTTQTLREEKSANENPF